jgi:starch phosphorylase
MSISPYYLIPPLPKGLEGLAELALDLRWSWSHTADALWERLEPETWALTRNPWLILQTVSVTRLEELAHDAAFIKMVEEHLTAHQAALKDSAWFQRTHPGAQLTVAYFSMEFGLSEALPIYSGGLGILAGDHLKTASDLGFPLVGIGLLYQQGYFRQSLDARGVQTEFYPYNDPGQLPILPVRDPEGEWLRIEIQLPGRPLRLRIWEAKVCRTTLYLLDSNDPLNSPADRGITSELYGGGTELRLQQEMVLGIGGWRLLQALAIRPEVCHLNEGHAALAVLERARTIMAETGLSFGVALAATRPGNLFTTHTPVEAGFDRFEPTLMGQYLGPYATGLGLGLKEFLALGRLDPESVEEPFNMAYLAVRGAGAINAVSRLHGKVSRRIFQPLFPRWPREEIPVSYVTNGVHTPSWDSADADGLWSEACGKERWLDAMTTIGDDLKRIPDEVLWDFRSKGRQQLVRHVSKRIAWQLEATGATTEQIREAGQHLDPNVITIGFARRFATYKRPNLLLHDQKRLIRILSNPHRPVQLIVAGKAHPRDEAGKALVRAWSEFVRRSEVRGRVIFLMDYDMVLAELLVQGVDLWINTPRRPWEACGTSGMKVLVNGGLNLSELDGWWAEAYCPDVGWALGDGKEHGDDPDWDAFEAGQLYRLLEEEVIPCFYDRDERGIPRRWLSRVRKSMAELTPRFSTNRMLREYVGRFYLPAAESFTARTAKDAIEAVRNGQWQDALCNNWRRLHFGTLRVHEEGAHYTFFVPVYLDALDPEAIRVQIYAEPQSGGEAEIHSMTRGESLTGTINGYLYTVQVPAKRPSSHYTPRIIPFRARVSVPLEAQQILWYR